MIHLPTVLVLGAGASVPYGFPTGWDLTKKIVEDSRTENGELRLCLRNAGIDEPTVVAFRKELEQTQFDSIDVFLEYHPHFRSVGKLAIAAALIPCERRSPFDPALPQQHWYRLLFNRLVDRHGFDGSLLSIITLNYERSLEQYLYMTLIQDFGLDETDAAQRVLKINFIHFHGQLGELPWKPTSTPRARPFTRAYGEGTLGDIDIVKGAANGIVIVSEFDPTSNPNVDRVRSCLRDARVIGFLGFGYHETVMDRFDLQPLVFEQSEGARTRRVYGSTYKVPEGRRRELASDIHGIDLGADHVTVYDYLQQSELIYQGRPRS